MINLDQKIRPSNDFFKNHKILWDFEIQIDHQILPRRPDLMLVKKKKKKKKKREPAF